MNERVAVGPTVLLLGNPNVGKTSIFNALTGESAKVGNYPGLTIERRVGWLKSGSEGQRIRVVDSPGTYSLSARSGEEQIAMRAALGLDDSPPDLALVILDSGQLSRCLYLGLELVELRLPVLFVLNMADEAPGLDVARLEALIGVPCQATSARSGQGVSELGKRIADLLQAKAPSYPKLRAEYPPAVIHALDAIAQTVPEAWLGPLHSVERMRALALWALGSVDEEDELQGIPGALREAVGEARRTRGESEQAPIDFDGLVVTARYRAIDELLSKLVVPEAKARRALSERVDRIVLHPVWGAFSFGILLLLAFQALFVWADPFIQLIERAVLALQDLSKATLPAGVLRDLLVEGVIGGVGNVLVFLPQICLLFLLIGLLEDSGYMARVAYLMDRVMKSLGLHGRAFVPMFSGFACAVPAILSTRTLERERDRILTMLVVPLMTCSARLPIYSLVIAALFPPESSRLPVQGLLLLSIYLFSMLTTLLAAWVLGRIAVRGKPVPLLLELPPYRLPRLKATLKMVVRRGQDFVTQAGGTILVATICLWALLSFPKPSGPCLTTTKTLSESSERASVEPPHPSAPKPSSASPAGAETVCLTPIAQSYGGRIGRALEPALAPLGFDWKIGTAILGAFAAREVFVSTLALVYGVDSDDQELPLRERIQKERYPDGRPVYTPLVGLSLMVFFALACQCMSTLAVIRRETGSFRYPILVFGYMTILAYGASFVVFQTGRMLGF
jgi:ferrous iron transport protein B